MVDSRAVTILSALLFSTVGASAQQATTNAGELPHITMPGRATVEVVPTVATISLGIVIVRPKATDASAESAKATQKVLDEIATQNIEARDISTESVTLLATYDQIRDPDGKVRRGNLRGYRAENNLRIRVRSIEQAGTLAKLLIDRGANSLRRMSFSLENTEKYNDDLRVRAAQDAQHKARVYVEALGVKLGRILKIEPSQRFAGAEADLPVRSPIQGESVTVAIPTMPGVLELTMEVDVTWELVQ